MPTKITTRPPDLQTFLKLCPAFNIFFRIDRKTGLCLILRTGRNGKCLMCRVLLTLVDRKVVSTKSNGIVKLHLNKQVNYLRYTNLAIEIQCFYYDMLEIQFLWTILSCPCGIYAKVGYLINFTR